MINGRPPPAVEGCKMNLKRQKKLAKVPWAKIIWSKWSIHLSWLCSKLYKVTHVGLNTPTELSELSSWSEPELREVGHTWVQAPHHTETMRQTSCILWSEVSAKQAFCINLWLWKYYATKSNLICDPAALWRVLAAFCLVAGKVGDKLRTGITADSMYLIGSSLKKKHLSVPREGEKSNWLVNGYGNAMYNDPEISHPRAPKQIHGVWLWGAG